MKKTRKIKFIRNPQFKEIMIVISLTKFKTIELQLGFLNNLNNIVIFDCNLEIRRKIDHPGFLFSLALFPVYFYFDFHDNRHLEDFR